MLSKPLLAPLLLLAGLLVAAPSWSAPVVFCELAALPSLPLASDPASERLPPAELLERLAQSYRGLLEFGGDGFSKTRLEAQVADSAGVASPEKFFASVPGRDQRSVALNESLTKLGDWVLLESEDLGLTQEMITVRLREVVRAHLGQASQEQVRTEETREEQRDVGRETSTGAVFYRDTRFPELGEAYRDPDGMVWGDVVKNPDGTPRRMNHAEALRYCQEIGAELSSRDDFARLREYLGAIENRSASFVSGYKAQILPGLILGRSFWISKVCTNPRLGYIFAGANGSISPGVPRDARLLVRCVRR